jgi:hypothetical protein
MIKKFAFLCGALASLAAAVPAQAGRTAIDQYPDGSQLTYTLGGYCDFDGVDCSGSESATLPYATLPYSVSFGLDGTNRIWIHGNGILSFGQPAFRENFGSIYETPASSILQGIAPSLDEYQRDLVSGGQNISLDRNSVREGQYKPPFMQSARLTVNAKGVIFANWFTCTSPTSPTSCPSDPGSEYSLVLSPTARGFLGRVYGQSPGSDIGYVKNGEVTLTGNSFLMPATFSGNVTFVPEPSTWALLIAGFGMTGTALRRRRIATI